jgi:hypothetical protein
MPLVEHELLIFPENLFEFDSNRNTTQTESMILVNFQIHYHKTKDSIYRKCNDTKEVFRSRNPKKDRQHQ